MDFIRINEDIFRLDMITRIREGKNEETFYGRSVRKGAEAWLEIYFIGGDVLKLEGDAAMAMRRFLRSGCQIEDLSALSNEGRAPAPQPAAAHPPASPPPTAQPMHAQLRGRGHHS